MKETIEQKEQSSETTTLPPFSDAHSTEVSTKLSSPPAAQPTSMISAKKIFIILGILIATGMGVLFLSITKSGKASQRVNTSGQEDNTNSSDFTLTGLEVSETMEGEEITETHISPTTVFTTKVTPPPPPSPPPDPISEPVREEFPVAYKATSSILMETQKTGGDPSSIAGVGQSTPSLLQAGAQTSDPQQQFLEGQKNKSDFILPSIPEPILSDQMISAGTTIPIIITTGINSSTPGPIQAVITQDVYATYAPSKIMIPRGSRLIGSYQTSVAYGVDRSLIAWNRLIRDDGISIDLRGMQSVDLSGYAGLPAKVDNHWDKILGALLVATVLNIGYIETGIPLSNSLAPQSVQMGIGATLSNANQITDKIIDRAMDIPPHLIIKPGKEAYLFIRQDIYLLPYEGGLP